MEETTGWPEYSSSTNVSVKKPDNPQAYPCLDSSGFGLSMRDPGMTLRDWFAGQAMAAMLTGVVAEIGGAIGAYHRGDCNAVIVQRAYIIADAMLAERERSQ